MMPYYMNRLSQDALLCGDTKDSVPFVNATRVDPVTGQCPDGYAGCLRPEAPEYKVDLQTCYERDGSVSEEDDRAKKCPITDVKLVKKGEGIQEISE